MRRLLGPVLAAVAATMLLAVSAGQALATTVHCGDVITESVVLDSDLNCPGDGIVIGASNVTLDLNGHTISGQGSGNGISVLPPPQVPPYTRQNIEVRNGVVRNFKLSVAMENVVGAVIRDLTADGGGIWCFGGQCTIEHTHVTSAVPTTDQFAYGILFAQCYASEVRGNVVRGMGKGITIGPGTRGFVIAGNVLADNAVGIQIAHSGATMTENRISGSRSAAIDEYSGGGPIIHNELTGNPGAGIVVEERSGGPILDNVVSNNGADGIQVAPEYASATIERNLVLRNGGDGISAGEGGTQIMANIVSRNALDGIFVRKRDDFYGGGTVVERNHADHNSGDGIHTDSANANLTDNHTWFNGNLGIEAAPGTLGGDNWAKHNANPLQCVPGTLCSTAGKPKG
jgi:Right handed beta helix region